jgi:hypothetical protein
MFIHYASRFGLVLTASVVLAACGSSTKTGIDAKDSARTSSDEGPVLDLPTDNNLVQGDAALDAGIVTSDAALDTPLIGRDSASLDTTIIGIDASLDNPVQNDAAADGFALDGGVDSAGVDSGYDGATAGQDGGWMDSGGTASLTINPKNGDFGIVYPTPTPPLVFTVSNVGSAPSGTFTVTISGNAISVSYYRISSNSCDKPLPAGESCQLGVMFIAPGGAGGPYVASLNIAAEGIPGGRFTVQLSGETP